MKGAIKLLLLIISAILVVACGGGGGDPQNPGPSSSSSSNSSSSSSSSGSDSSSSTSSSSSSSGGDNSAPTARILFPAKDAQTSKSTVTVRGTATDDSGIQSIMVNGVAASFQPVAANSGLQKTKTENTVEWEITLELEPGDNNVEVEVVDASGNEGAEPEEVLIRYTQFPVDAVLDTTNDRLIGVETFGTGLALDLEAKAITEVPAVSAGRLLAVHSSGEEVYSIIYVESNLILRSMNLTSGIESIVQTNAFSPDDTLWDGAYLWDSFFVESGNLVYVLYQFKPSGSSNLEPKLYVWSLSDNTMTNIPLFVDGGVVPSIDGIEPGEGSLIGLVSPFLGADDRNSVVSINPVSGEITTITSEIDAVANKFVVDSMGDFAWLVGYKSVVRVDLESGAAATVSLDADQDLFNLAQISSVILDETRGLLYVSDIAIRETIAIDLLDGNRSLLYPNGIGEGRKLIAPRELALTSDNLFAYVLDDGDNTPESLFRINLATGDRERLGDIAAEFNYLASGIALDEASNRVFYSLYENVFAMDLDDQSITAISSDTVGTGVVLESVSGMYYDHVIETLLVVDGANDRLISIDPATKHREIVASLTEGDSPYIEAPVDVAVSPDGDTYYVFGQQRAALYAVNAETGERELLLDECLNNWGQDRLPPDTAVQNIDFNPTLGKFLLTGDMSIIEYDLATDTCRVVSEAGALFSILDVLYQNDGTILGSSWNRILQFDPVNGEYITLSK